MCRIRLDTADENMSIHKFITDFLFIQIQSISFPVLRDVLRVERGDAQTNRDLQKT